MTQLSYFSVVSAYQSRTKLRVLILRQFLVKWFTDYLNLLIKSLDIAVALFQIEKSSGNSLSNMKKFLDFCSRSPKKTLDRREYFLHIM